MFEDLMNAISLLKFQPYEPEINLIFKHKEANDEKVMVYQLPSPLYTG